MKARKRKLKPIISTVIVLLMLATGWWVYNNFSDNFQEFQKTEIGNLITQVGKEVLAPPPLNVGGKATQVVLIKDKITSETNLQRVNNNLFALSENAKLSKAALSKANDMFSNQYFEHISPSGVSPDKLVQSFGYEYIITGENLILGNFDSERELVQFWMDSPGHKANILNGRYTEIGVAVVKGSYNGDTVWIAVQEFGLPLSTCPEPSLSLKGEIEYYESQLDKLSFEIDEKKHEIENTKRRNKNYNNLASQYNELVKQYNLLADKVKNVISQYNSQVNLFNQCVAGNN